MKQVDQFTMTISVNGSYSAVVNLAASVTRQWLKAAGDDLLGHIDDRINVLEDDLPEHGPEWFYGLVRVEVDPELLPRSPYFMNDN